MDIYNHRQEIGKWKAKKRRKQNERLGLQTDQASFLDHKALFGYFLG